MPPKKSTLAASRIQQSLHCIDGDGEGVDREGCRDVAWEAGNAVRTHTAQAACQPAVVEVQKLPQGSTTENQTFMF